MKPYEQKITDYKMLTFHTQKAIAILCDIRSENNVATAEEYSLSDSEFRDILEKLIQSGFINLKDAEFPNMLSSYTYCYSSPQLTLYQLLVALEEGIYLTESTIELHILHQILHTLLNRVMVSELYHKIKK